jgi:hypothetical protein
LRGASFIRACTNETDANDGRRSENRNRSASQPDRSAHQQIPRTADAASGGSPSGQTDLLGGAGLGQFGIDADTVDKIKDQFDGFVDVLEKHLQEIPAGTALAIFALGVLLGRLLPR